MKSIRNKHSTKEILTAIVLGEILFLEIMLRQAAKIGATGLSEMLKEQEVRISSIPKGVSLVGVSLVRQSDPIGRAGKEYLEFVQGKKALLHGFGFKESFFKGSDSKGILLPEDLKDLCGKFSREIDGEASPIGIPLSFGLLLRAFVIVQGKQHVCMCRSGAVEKYHIDPYIKEDH